MVKKQDSFIHIKLEYDEAKQSRKDLLSTEMDLINVMKSMEKFLAIRNIELNLKAKLFRELKKISMNIKLLETEMPQIRMPKLRKEEHVVEEPIIQTKSNDELENQLAEIQRKLKELSY